MSNVFYSIGAWLELASASSSDLYEFTFELNIFVTRLSFSGNIFLTIGVVMFGLVAFWTDAYKYAAKLNITYL